MRAKSLSRCRTACRLPDGNGPVAQWLEPAAHNGLVAGSSPAGPTTLSPSAPKARKQRALLIRKISIITAMAIILNDLDDFKEALEWPV